MMAQITSHLTPLLVAPQNKLVHDLSFEVGKSDSLLLTGHNGKSTKKSTPTAAPLLWSVAAASQRLEQLTRLQHPVLTKHHCVSSFALLDGRRRQVLGVPLPRRALDYPGGQDLQAR